MRYCPHCHRFNPGHPMICHFCGRTWYVRLCPRGHENPPTAQYCGVCASMDLSETAGRRPWLLIALKLFLWFLAGWLVYSIVVGFGNLLRKPQAVHLLLSQIIIICILLFGFWFSLSLLPKPLGKAGGRLGKRVLGVFGLVVRWVLKKVRKSSNQQ